MKTKPGARHILFWPATWLLMLILTQLVTFLASFFFPGMENFPRERSLIFVIILGITYTVGVYLGGWMAQRLGWIELSSHRVARLVWTALGAYLPLVLALLIYRSLEPGNLFFFVAALTAILAYFIPDWLVGR